MDGWTGDGGMEWAWPDWKRGELMEWERIIVPSIRSPMGAQKSRANQKKGLFPFPGSTFGPFVVHGFDSSKKAFLLPGVSISKRYLPSLSFQAVQVQLDSPKENVPLAPVVFSALFLSAIFAVTFRVGDRPAATAVSRFHSPPLSQSPFPCRLPNDPERTVEKREETRFALVRKTFQQGSFASTIRYVRT